jgi:hypothetical protein
MAPITWRNVTAPQFSDSVAALGLAGRLMDQAGTGFQAALGTFDTWRTEQNDRIALDAASRIQNPTDYRAALEAGTAMGGLPPTAVSSRTRAALDARAGDLIGRQTALDTMQRTARDDSAEVNARGVIAQALGLAQNGDSEGAARLLSQGAAAGLPIQQQMAVAGRTSDLTSGQVARTGQRQQQAQNAWQFDLAQANEADRRVAQETIDRMQRSGENAGDYEYIFGSVRPNLTPGASALVQRWMTSQGAYGASGGVAPPVAGGPRTAAAPTAPGGGGGGSGGATLPPVGSRPNFFAETNTHGERIIARLRADNVDLTGSYADIAARLEPYIAHQESGNRHRNRDGSLVTSPAGAEGAMQVMPGTQRDPGFRVRPAADNSEAENRRVGRDYFAAMLQRYRGDIRLALAAYNAGPARADAWQARQNQERADRATGQQAAEAGTGAREVIAGAADATTRLQQVQSTRRGNSPITDMARAQTSTDDALAIVAANKAAFPGIPEAEILQAVQGVMAGAEQRGQRINPAMAMVLLRRNATTNHRGFFNSIAPGNWAGTASIEPNSNVAGVRNDLDAYFRDPAGAQEALRQDNALSRDAEGIAQARTALEEAIRQRDTTTQGAQNNPERAHLIPSRELAVIEATRRLRSLLVASSSNPNHVLPASPSRSALRPAPVDEGSPPPTAPRFPNRRDSPAAASIAQATRPANETPLQMWVRMNMGRDLTPRALAQAARIHDIPANELRAMIASPAASQ